MLNKHQIAQLKSLSMTMSSNYQIGKNEISPALIEMLDKALTKHELIKISVNRVIVDQKKIIAEQLCESLHAELVQIIGGVIVLYRKNLKNPVIKLVS